MQQPSPAMHPVAEGRDLSAGTGWVIQDTFGSCQSHTTSWWFVGAARLSASGRLLLLKSNSPQQTVDLAIIFLSVSHPGFLLCNCWVGFLRVWIFFPGLIALVAVILLRALKQVTDTISKLMKKNGIFFPFICSDLNWVICLSCLWIFVLSFLHRLWLPNLPQLHFHIPACLFFVNHLASAYLNIKNFFNHQRQEHSFMNIHIFFLLRLDSSSLPCSKAKQSSIALITAAGVLIGCLLLVARVPHPPALLHELSCTCQQQQKNINNARINFSGWKTTLQTCQTVLVTFFLFFCFTPKIKKKKKNSEGETWALEMNICQESWRKFHLHNDFVLLH